MGLAQHNVRSGLEMSLTMVAIKLIVQPLAVWAIARLSWSACVGDPGCGAVGLDCYRCQRLPDVASVQVTGRGCGQLSGVVDGTCRGDNTIGTDADIMKSEWLAGLP